MQLDFTLYEILKSNQRYEPKDSIDSYFEKYLSKYSIYKLQPLINILNDKIQNAHFEPEPSNPSYFTMKVKITHDYKRIYNEMVIIVRQQGYREYCENLFSVFDGIDTYLTYYMLVVK
jgi:hypothetical protein